jgi:hypothetical protein
VKICGLAEKCEHRAGPEDRIITIPKAMMAAYDAALRTAYYFFTASRFLPDISV